MNSLYFDFSMCPKQENTLKKQAEIQFDNERPTLSSQSAPIFADVKFYLSDKTKERATQSTRKYHTYALPTPIELELKNSASITTNISSSSALSKDKPGSQTERKHAPQMEEHHRAAPDSKDKNLSPSPTRSPKTPSAPSPIRSPKMPSVPPKQSKSPAFSGPITQKTGSNKAHSAPYGFSQSHVLNLSVTPSFSTYSSAPISSSSSLKISDLHELPRPPISLQQSGTLNSFTGHSAPLISRGQEIQAGRMFPVSLPKAASPLPTPPPALVPRSLSIPLKGLKSPSGTGNKQLELLHLNHLNMNEEIDSPTLIPLSLKGLALSSSPKGKV